MRAFFLILPLALLASPAVAQPASKPVVEIPQQLTDPAFTDRIGDLMQALTRAVMDMRVGEVRAAVEGRSATVDEQQLTVRDVAADPDLDERIGQEVAQAGPALQQGVQALASALPAVMESLGQAAEAMERASTSLPSPSYPKR